LSRSATRGRRLARGRNLPLDDSLHPLGQGERLLVAFYVKPWHRARVTLRARAVPTPRETERSLTPDGITTVKTWLVATAERLERATRSHAAWPILSQRPGDRRQSLRRLGGRAEPRRLFEQQLVEAEAAAMAGSGRTMLGFPLLVPLR